MLTWPLAGSILKNHLAENPGVFATYLMSGDLVAASSSQFPSTNADGNGTNGANPPDDDVDMDSSAPATQDTAPGSDGGGDEDRMVRPEITGLRVLKPIVDERVRRRGMFLVGADQVEGGLGRVQSTAGLRDLTLIRSTGARIQPGKHSSYPTRSGCTSTRSHPRACRCVPSHLLPFSCLLLPFLCG